MQKRVWPGLLAALLVTAVGTLIALPLLRSFTRGKKGRIEAILEVDTTGQDLSASQLTEALGTTREILEARVETLGYGVEIERIGDTGFRVTLIDTDDVDRLLAMIGSPGRLEFRFVADYSKIEEVLLAIDSALTAGRDNVRRPFTGLLIPVRSGMAVKLIDYPYLNTMLTDVKEAVPGDVEVLFGPDEQLETDLSIDSVVRVYVIEKEVLLTGTDVITAEAKLYSGSEPRYSGTWLVELDINTEAMIEFSDVTAENIGRYLAIVVDNEVKTTPVISERVPPTINPVIMTNDYSGYDAHNLAAVISSGTLRLPVRVVEVKNPDSASTTLSLRIIVIGGGVLLLAILAFLLVFFLTNRKAGKPESITGKEV